jgi:hypothetical protein
MVGGRSRHLARIVNTMNLQQPGMYHIEISLDIDIALAEVGEHIRWQLRVAAMMLSMMCKASGCCYDLFELLTLTFTMNERKYGFIPASRDATISSHILKAHEI